MPGSLLRPLETSDPTEFHWVGCILPNDFKSVVGPPTTFFAFIGPKGSHGTPLIHQPFSLNFIRRLPL